MGKTVVKQSDMEKFFDLIDSYSLLEHSTIEEKFEEVFSVYDDTKSVAKQEQEKENK